MCLPPNVISSRIIGRTRDSNAGQWAVDQRPFIWTAGSKSSEMAKGPVSTSWAEIFNLGGPLPYSGFAEAAVTHEPLQVGVPLTLGCSPGAAATAPEPNELEKRQSKGWEGRPPVYGPSRMDTPTPQPSTSSRQGSVVSCTSNPKGALIPAVQESSQSTKVSDRVGSWESSRSKEEGSRKSFRVNDPTEEDRMQDAVALRNLKLSSSSTCTGKRSRKTSEKHCNRSTVPKKEIATRLKDVCTFESLSDNEGPSDDEGEDGPGVSEKRRKRMLSNRASAQRSRQRRQERLDTLEVLVAQLRVESAALTRKANSAIAAAKKLEEENKILRDRLWKHEHVAVCGEGEKMTESAAVGDRSNGKMIESGAVGDGSSGKDGSLWRAAVLKAEATTNALNGESSEKQPQHHDRCPRMNCRLSGSKPSKSKGEPVEKQLQHWNPTESPATTVIDRRTLNRAPLQDKTLNQISQDYGGTHSKDLYLEMSVAMSLPQTPPFQGLDPFGIHVDHGNQEMDKNNLDSRSVEEIWLESLTYC